MLKKKSKDVENHEEVKVIKKQYKKMRNIILICLSIFIILFAIKFLHDFVIIHKVLKVNYADLGDNYKITFYENQLQTPRYIYYKDGITKYLLPNAPSNIVITKDGYLYVIQTEKKTYTKFENVLGNSKGVSLSYMSFGVDMDIQHILQFMILERCKVSKEEYKNQNYITLQFGMYKMWINPTTYYVEKEIFSGQVTEKVIEKNVVTEEDIKMPNLEGYTESVVSQ